VFDTVPATAILPVKRFDHAKQRLGPQLGPGARAALASAMLSDVLAALDHSASLKSVMLVSGEPAVQAFAVGARIVVIPDLREKGQSPAALAGLARATELGCKRAFLIPGDCPLIDAGELDNLVASSTADGIDAAIVPDRHRRGTNALLLDPAAGFEPQFGPDSLARHVEQAMQRGLRYSVQPLPSLALDVDTSEDLAQLVALLGRERERAPHTRAVLRQLERTHPLPVPA
jgi:2-phospho-L-lactate guanylyltransferase